MLLRWLAQQVRLADDRPGFSVQVKILGASSEESGSACGELACVVREQRIIRIFENEHVFAVADPRRMQVEKRRFANGARQRTARHLCGRRIAIGAIGRVLVSDHRVDGRRPAI